SADAAQAHQATWRLVAAGKQTVSFLQRHLPPIAPVEPRLLDRLIQDLAHDDFAVREKATQTLEKLGDLAESALSQAQRDPLPLEAHKRVQRLLEKLGPEPSPERLSIIRGIKVLEYLNTLESRSLLKTLAQGVPGSQLTREAKAALERLAKRPIVMP